MGAFYPFVSKAMTGEVPPDPTLPCCLYLRRGGLRRSSNYFFMRFPLDGREAARCGAIGRHLPAGTSGAFWVERFGVRGRWPILWLRSAYRWTCRLLFHWAGATMIQRAGECLSGTNLVQLPLVLKAV